ncbi:hypothetical protein AKJ66_00430 [candidate division MSBL1 archaeon SCGC-AAA259E22]|uniref:Uncharacterized protein n=1 Tax=candidate division MSBL1 archaeon SCGC-AAA259E22 TaxID=1698265 RepID=A0A133UI95_9EURY|nr:hypothetical protein AKJ66_00430 [candidate division MSBL1 archaeon SCGC-AAA259E22]
MTNHGDLLRAVRDLDASDELKDVLKLMIRYIDIEDKKTHSESVKMLRKEIEDLRGRVYDLEEEAVVR